MERFLNRLWRTRASRRTFLRAGAGGAAALALTSADALAQIQPESEPPLPPVINPSSARPDFLQKPRKAPLFDTNPDRTLRAKYAGLLPGNCEPLTYVDSGKAGYYTEDDDGCRGCRPDRRMSNGQRYNQNALTLAHNTIPDNTPVLVKNLDNGLYSTAIVTDSGGFGELNRIADLSLALARKIQLETDKSTIEIRVIKCS